MNRDAGAFQVLGISCRPLSFSLIATRTTETSTSTIDVFDARTLLHYCRVSFYKYLNPYADTTFDLLRGANGLFHRNTLTADRKTGFVSNIAGHCREDPSRPGCSVAPNGIVDDGRATSVGL